MYDLLARLAVNVLETSSGVLNATWNVWRLSAERAEGNLAPVLETARDIVSPDQSLTPARINEKLVSIELDIGRKSADAMGRSMYNLQKAKEEIDAVAKHATDLAAHMLGITENVDAKLESFKKQIVGAIDARFAEMERTVLGGDVYHMESSAIGDLGAQMSRLIHGAPAPAHDGESIDASNLQTSEGGHSKPHDDHHQERNDANLHGEHRHADHSHDDHSHDNHHQEYRG